MSEKEQKVRISIPLWLKEDIEEFRQINDWIEEDYNIHSNDDFIEEAVQYYIDSFNLYYSAIERGKIRQEKQTKTSKSS